MEILNYKIKVWLLVVGIIILILIIFIFVKYLDHNHRISIEPEFLEYTQDIILGYRWKWNWQKDIYGKYYEWILFQRRYLMNLKN